MISFFAATFVFVGGYLMGVAHSSKDVPQPSHKAAAQTESKNAVQAEFNRLDKACKEGNDTACKYLKTVR